MVSIVFRLFSSKAFFNILQGFFLIFLGAVCVAQGPEFYTPYESSLFPADSPATDWNPGISEPPFRAPYAPHSNRPFLLWGNERASYSQRPVNNLGGFLPITPGFSNYGRWTQQVTSPRFWQVLPSGLIYPSYLAGPKEARFAGVWNHDKNLGWVWDATAGGRMPLLRYGTKESVLPEGFQIDLEGAAMVRIDYEHELDLLGADFRGGIPITFGDKRTQYKFAYYHISSHLGDEYMLRQDARERVNYVRDALVFAIAYRIQRDIRLYGETAWAFFTGEKTKPWEFQFGAEYSPIYPANRQYGSPFFALNGHLLQELNFGGNFNAQLGWQWRGPNNNLLRIGLQYFCGASDQHSYQDTYENKIGLGLWADF